MKKIVLTDIQKENIKQSLLNKKTLTELSLEMKISKETLGKIAREIMGESFSFKRKSYLNEKYFDSIETPEQAYWLGFLAADGYIVKNEINIQLQKQDKTHLKKFSEAINGNLTVRDINGKNNFGTSFSHHRVSFKSNYMVESLGKKGICPTKSLTLKYPHFLENNLQSFWIIGYLDGDGCISKNKNKMRIIFTGTEDVLVGIKNFLSSKNVISKEHRCENTFKLQVENNISYNFLKLMNYSELYFALDRKKQKFIEYSSVIEQSIIVNNENCEKTLRVITTTT